MRALRSRNLQSDSDNNENKSEVEYPTKENVTKRIKRKKRTSNENEHLEEVPEEISTKKRKSMKIKKELPNGSDEYEMDTKTLNTSTDNMAEMEVVVKKKKSKKVRKELTKDDSEYETKPKVLNISTENTSETEQQEKIVKKKKSKKAKKKELMTTDSDHETNTEPANISTENTSETEQQEKIVKKKKSKKAKKKELMTADSDHETNTKPANISTENTSETDQQEEVIVKKKKSKKLKKRSKDNHSDVQSAETEPEVFNTSTKSEQETEDDAEKAPKKRGREPRQFLRSTIFGSPNFDNAVTSTAMKPKRPENIEDDEFSAKVSEIKAVKKERKLQRQSAVDSPSIRRETFVVPKIKVLNETADIRRETFVVPKIKVLNETADIRRETFVVPKIKVLNETADILDLIDNNLLDKSKNKAEKNQKRLSNSSLNGNRVSDSKRQTYIKPNVQMDSVIAISDSPDVTRFKKSNNLEPEITSDEESSSSTIKDKSKSESVPTRRETFSKLPKNKVLLPGLENTIITILDSPDKSRKRSTFNKSNVSQPEITSDEDSPAKDSSTLKKLKTPNQSLNSTKTKDRLSTKNDSTNSRRETFCRPTKNNRKSDELFPNPNDSTKSDDKRKSERLSDVGDSILENSVDIDSPETTRRTRSSTFNLSNNTINKTDTNNIANTSGDWKIEVKETPNNKEKMNGTFDIENKENKSKNSSEGSNTTIKIESENPTVKIENIADKSIRKKWLKFPRHSTDAQSVLESISSPRLQKKMNASKIVEKVMKTPTNLYKLQKPTITPSSLSVQKKSPRSTKKSPLTSTKKSIIGSNKKSVTKRTVMPNFALIHQKAFEKMENLAEYSDRKKQRAQMLLSNNPSSKRKSVKQEETKGKSSRQLFSVETNDAKNVKNDIKFNRFGFKFGESMKPSQIPVVKPAKTVAIVKSVVKPSVFARSEVVAIANKNKVVTNNREKRKDQLKGVRTNRRFELLMQMRNK